MNKKEAEDFTKDLLVTDALIKLKALGNILISKNIITKEEFDQEMNNVANQITKEILKMAQIPGNLEDIIKNYKPNTNN